MNNLSMYWRPNNDSSKIENLLNTEGVSLRDVLLEDGVINEVQVYNEKLLNYLITPKHISEMLNILISKPQPNEDGILFFGEQNIVSEILSSYVNVIYSTLSNNYEYLAILFKPFIVPHCIDGDCFEEPINSVTCSLILKVAKVLCQQSCEKLLNFLMSVDGILDQFVNNIECNSVIEFLVKCIQSFQPNEILSNYLKWLSKEDIIGKLLAKIDQKSETQNSNQSIQCLLELLSAIKSTKVENPLISDLQNTRVVTHILSVMLSVSASKMSMITTGLEFIKAIFEIPEKQSLSNFTSPLYQTYKKTNINSKDILENPNLYNPIIDCLVMKLPDFKIILEDTSELKNIRIPTAYGGEIVGPLGPHRLALIDLIHHLVLLEQNRIYDEIINCEIISTLINLFFEFHLNTFLHRFVTEIINKLITYASETLVTNDGSNSCNNISEKIIYEVIINQDLLNKIVITWNKNMTQVAGTNRMIRNTHRPFLKEIANTIDIKFFTFEKIIDQNTLKMWKTFAETKLAEENKRNNIRKKNMMAYHDSSSEGESAIETIEDIDSEDSLKIYEDCIQQEMAYTFPDYLYKPIFFQEKSSLESELNSNPLRDFFISTQEDIENAENFEAVCNVLLNTKRPFDNSVKQNECLTNDLELTLTNDVENIDEIYENNYNKSSNIQTNVIDSVFREAYKDLNQSPKQHEIKIMESRSTISHQMDATNNRFQFRTSTGLPILNNKPKFLRKLNSIKIEKSSDSIIVGSTVVPRLKFDDFNEKKEVSRSLYVPSLSVRQFSDDKETQPGSPFSVDDIDELEEETPLCSTARYIPNERLSDFSDESDDDDTPLSSRFEKGQMKPSENLSQLDNRLDDKTWCNPSNNLEISTDDVDVEFDTVQNVTPNLVVTHCNTFSSMVVSNFPPKSGSDSSIPIPVTSTNRPANDESVIKSDEAEPNRFTSNVEVFAIENPFSPKLVRHSIHNANKETGLNKTKVFESSKCLTLSSNSKSNNSNTDYQRNSAQPSRHTFSSILYPMSWTSFQKVNRSISAPITDTTTLGFHNTEDTKAQSLVNGIEESHSSSLNRFDVI